MDFVSIIMGSKSDYEIMKNCANTLEMFNVKYELIISSAHRSPDRTKKYIKEAEDKGAKVFIAAAGMAAHLAGALAAGTTKPFIGTPITGFVVAAEVLPYLHPKDTVKFSSNIRDYLSTKLDAYKIPALIKVVKSLKINASGKMNRTSLWEKM